MSYPTLPTSTASRCLALLREGPATTSDVAIELAIPSKLASAHLSDLHSRGKVSRKPFAPGRKWLWSLVEEARAA